jgi:hypothetical protein
MSGGREQPGLGRRRGIFVPLRELQAYEVCGWTLVDDLAGMSAADDDGEPLVLMAPPKEFEREAAW